MEKNKKEEKPDVKYVEGVDKKISKVEIEPDKYDQQRVERVRFVAEDGDITWKPKVEQEEKRGGAVIKRRIGYLIDDFLEIEKVKHIIDEIREKGIAKINLCYSYIEDVKDGQKVTYRFVLGEKSFNKLQIIKDAVPTEQVGA